MVNSTPSRSRVLFYDTLYATLEKEAGHSAAFNVLCSNGNLKSLLPPEDTKNGWMKKVITAAPDRYGFVLSFDIIDYVSLQSPRVGAGAGTEKAMTAPPATAATSPVPSTSSVPNRAHFYDALRTSLRSQPNQTSKFNNIEVQHMKGLLPPADQKVKAWLKKAIQSAPARYGFVLTNQGFVYTVSLREPGVGNCAHASDTVDLAPRETQVPSGAGNGTAQPSSTATSSSPFVKLVAPTATTSSAPPTAATLREATLPAATLPAATSSFLSSSSGRPSAISSSSSPTSSSLSSPVGLAFSPPSYSFSSSSSSSSVRETAIEPPPPPPAVTAGVVVRDAEFMQHFNRRWEHNISSNSRTKGVFLFDHIPSTSVQQLQLHNQQPHHLLQQQQQQQQQQQRQHIEVGLIGRRIDVPATNPGHELYMNVTDPFCMLVVGMQGSGKSHTMACVIESCLLPRPPVTHVKKPMTVLVFHYHQSGESRCEVVGLCRPNRNLGIPTPFLPHEKLIVLCSPTYYLQRKKYYHETLGLSSCQVCPLLFKWGKDIKATHLKILMQIQNHNDNSKQQLYVAVMLRLLRQHQRNDVVPGYDDFMAELKEACTIPTQKEAIEQRLQLLSTFIYESEENSDLRDKCQDLSGLMKSSDGGWYKRAHTNTTYTAPYKHAQLVVA
eukprot:TRINITY_DN3371_c0_g1_i2.p1 TRINITY_DN3371_c0_g1~~TRINITY_DN3371_c0_g1_i2.p1  ORF type:complete len:665 (-),score=116.97 TRINITY_DN3371_c0_g1_i2:647-2641(-)